MYISPIFSCVCVYACACVCACVHHKHKHTVTHKFTDLSKFFWCILSKSLAVIDLADIATGILLMWVANEWAGFLLRPAVVAPPVHCDFLTIMYQYNMCTYIHIHITYIRMYVGIIMYRGVRMYVCMHICIYVCMYVCMFVHDAHKILSHQHIHMCTHIHTACMDKHMYTQTDRQTHTHRYTDTDTHTHTHTHRHRHTQTQTHTETRRKIR